MGRPPLVRPPLVGHEVVGHEVVRAGLVVGGMGRRLRLRRTHSRRSPARSPSRRSRCSCSSSRDLPAYELGPRIPWWALAVAFAATELFVVHAHVRGSAHSLSISELPLILGLLLATPQDLVIAQFAGPGARARASRAGTRRSSSSSTSPSSGSPRCLAVDHAARAGAGAASELGPQLWFAAFAAVGASALTGATLVFAAIALAEGVIPSRRLALMMGADLLVSLTNTSVGLAGATLVAQDARAGWLLLAPACILLLAYRAYLSERTKHESLEFLYGVARSLSRAPDIETRAGRPAAPHARRVPRRGGRDRALLRRRHAAAHRARRRGGEERMEPIEPSLAARAARLRAAPSRRRWSSARRATGELRALPGARGISEALSRRCPGETRLTGVMVLGDRVGAASSFTGEDVRLFETLANHAGISLEYDRLEQAVTRMRELQARLEHQAFRDSLTGLGNRALFLRRLEESLRARRRGDDRAVPRPRRLQGDQRRARPRGGRRGAGGGRRPHPRRVRPGDLAARLGRRRVRGAARGRRRRARRGRSPSACSTCSPRRSLERRARRGCTGRSASPPRAPARSAPTS